jgi:hypothetical protein
MTETDNGSNFFPKLDSAMAGIVAIIKALHPQAYFPGDWIDGSSRFVSPRLDVKL